MALQAQTATINRVENGFLLTLHAYGSQVTLIAKGIDELIGLVRGVEWTPERPLSPTNTNVMGLPAVEASTYAIPRARISSAG